MTGNSARIRLRRIVFVGVIVLQLLFVVRAYWAPHKEFGFQMFPEASSWQAEIVRVTADGDRIPVEQPWFGYEWNDLASERGLASPWVRHHAAAGLDNQLAFLGEALDWLAANTPRDTETRYYEATVTTWFNMRGPSTETLRSPDRNQR
ncbi:MAG: hypothetical protein ABI782_10965 [Anaerolineaceae bacterium]